MTPIVHGVTQDIMSKGVQVFLDCAYHALALHAQKDCTDQNAVNMLMLFALRVPWAQPAHDLQVLGSLITLIIVVGAVLRVTNCLTIGVCHVCKGSIQATDLNALSAVLASTQLLFWQ